MGWLLLNTWIANFQNCWYCLHLKEYFHLNTFKYIWFLSLWLSWTDMNDMAWGFWWFPCRCNWGKGLFISVSRIVAIFENNSEVNWKLSWHKTSCHEFLSIYADHKKTWRKTNTSLRAFVACCWVFAINTLQTHHMDSTLKRRGKTWNPRSVFVGKELNPITPSVQKMIGTLKILQQMKILSCVWTFCWHYAIAVKFCIYPNPEK